MPGMLEGIGLCKAFGGVAAVDSVSIEVRRGAIHGLIGPNGAGKTTLFNLLAGTIRPDQGRIRFKDREITGWPPHRVAALGLTRTFQIARELDRLSVLENLLIAEPAQPGERLWSVFLEPGRVRSAQADAVERARETLATVGLSGREDLLASELSGGQKKLLELGRALTTKADLILLDEIGAGVAPALLGHLCDVIAELNRGHGKTFLMIEHNMGMIRRLCERVTVLAAGRVLTEGAFADVRSDDRVVEAYLGLAA